MLEQLQYQQRLPVRISETLFLGNANCVQNVRRLKHLGITAVLNLAGPMALKRSTIRALSSNKIEYKRLDALDQENYPLLPNDWLEAQEFIRESVAGGHGKCLVHCIAGVNRSVLTVAAYYMLSTKTPVLETMKHIRRQRGNNALQNEGFQEQLVAFARQNSLLGDSAKVMGDSANLRLPSCPLPDNKFGWHVRTVGPAEHSKG